MQISNDNKINYLEKTIGTMGSLYAYDFLNQHVASALFSPVAKRLPLINDIPPKEAKNLINSMLSSKKLKDNLNIITIMSNEEKALLKNTLCNDVLQVGANNNVIRFINKSVDELKQDIFTSAKNKKRSFIPKIFKSEPTPEEIFATFKSVADGKNAVFQPINSTIYSSSKKPTFLMHEIGHAINKNAFWGSNTFQKAASYIPKFLPAYFLAHSIWQELTNPQEKSFIKNNIGLLTSACFIPMLIEEGMASMRVLKNTAKANMPKAILNTQRKILGSAFASYVILAITSGVVAKFILKGISKIKDIRNEF